MFVCVCVCVQTVHLCVCVCDSDLELYQYAVKSLYTCLTHVRYEIWLSVVSVLTFS